MQYKNFNTIEIILLISFLVIVALCAIMTHLLLRIKKVRRDNVSELQQQLLEANITSLMARINPHFVFNILNSLMAVVQISDKDKALHYMNKFAKLLRYILERSDAKSATLKDEIELLNHYIELEKLRHNNMFEYKIEVSPEIDLYNTEIPVMILQPFIENALLHGLHKKLAGPDVFQGEIIVSYEKKEDKIICSIKDNGIGRKKSSELRPKDHVSKGTAFTEERLRLLSKNACRIFYNDLWCEKNNVALGTEVIVELPILN